MAPKLWHWRLLYMWYYDSDGAIVHSACDFQKYAIGNIIPEPTARSAVRRGLLIPHGYLHPGKSKHTAKCKVHQGLRARRYGSSFMGGHLTDLINMADRQQWKGQRSKKIYERTITQHEKKFFQPSLKGMIRFDLNMEHDEVHGKFVLTVCICSICIFAKKFPIAKTLLLFSQEVWLRILY